MRILTVFLLPVLALAGGCALRHERNRNLPPVTNDSKVIRHDLAPNGTPPAGPAERMKTEKASSGPTDDERDRRITEDVRRAITGDASLSTQAKQVVVTTDDGVVTLEGSVATEHERKLVREKALQVAGVISVENRTHVEPLR
jgi:hypothetical protein